MKKFMHFVLLTICLALIGCGDTQSEGKRHQLQILSLNLGQEPPTLDPGLAGDVTSMIILDMLFEGMTRMDENNIPQPAAAKRIEISPDGKRYTFHLRQAKWSNGDPVTAADFEYGWKLHLQPAHPSQVCDYLYVIKNAREAKQGKVPLDEIGIYAVDDSTLIVDLENPAPFFLELTQLGPFFPVHKATAENNPNWAFEASSAYISNGPFKLDSWAHHSQLEVIRNPFYWDKETVKLSKISMAMVEDSHTELSMFEKGEIDWAGMPISGPLPFDAMAALRAEGRLEANPLASNAYIVFNTEKPPFHNVKLREALAYAINRDEIVRNVTQGGEIPATTPLAYPLTRIEGPGFQDADIITAQRLFNEALVELGMTRESLGELAFTYSPSFGDHQLIQAIQQQWLAALGIQIELKAYEWKVFLDKTQQGDFGMLKIALLPGYSDPYSILHRLKEKDGRNITGWADPRFVAFINASEVTQNTVHRDEHLRNAEKVILEEMPFIPLYTLSSNCLKHPNLKGVHFTPVGWINFKRAYFD